MAKANETRNYVAIAAWNRKGGVHDQDRRLARRERQRSKVSLHKDPLDGEENSDLLVSAEIRNALEEFHRLADILSDLAQAGDGRAEELYQDLMDYAKNNMPEDPKNHALTEAKLDEGRSYIAKLLAEI